MPKRLIDTELWNNEQIVTDFTCDDRYFWLYLLTNPHGSICGVMKFSPAIIGRDMGLHQDTVINLAYRFENIYKLIVIDKDTRELLILNWYKWNWSTSEKLLSSVFNSKETIKSEFIKGLVQERIDLVTKKCENIPYPYGTISNTNNITKTNVDDNTYTTLEQVDDFFNKVYNLYPRKVSKEQARTTFTHKVFARDFTESRKRALHIYKCLERQIVEWSNEGNGKGRDKAYMPYMSSWLNDNFEDVPKKERGKTK